MENILLIAFSIGFLLSLTIIYNHSHWQKPKFWLGLLILTFSFILFDAWGSVIWLEDSYPIFGYTHYRLLMMIPICLWMYVNSLANSNKVQIGRFEKILFGFLCFEICILIFFFFTKGNTTPHKYLPLSTIIENICIINSLVVMWKANQTINEFKEKIKNNYADGMEQSYNWLKEFFVVLSCLLPIWLFVANAYFFTDIDINVWYRIIWTPLAILIFYIVIRAFSTKEILHDFELESGLAQNIANPSTTLDSKSSKADIEHALPCKLIPDAGQLQIEFSSTIYKRDKEQLALLISLINEKKLFQIKRLHIKECASLTGISKKEISKLVNYYLQLSFSDFVNLFRIEDFKHKIANGEATQYSLLHIALESGFSSKSTFYYTFKKLTNTSPVQIVNQYKKA